MAGTNNFDQEQSITNDEPPSNGAEVPSWLTDIEAEVAVDPRMNVRSLSIIFCYVSCNIFLCSSCLLVISRSPWIPSQFGMMPLMIQRIKMAIHRLGVPQHASK